MPSGMLHGRRVLITQAEAITTAQTVRPGESWRTTLHSVALPGLAVDLVP